MKFIHQLFKIISLTIVCIVNGLFAYTVSADQPNILVILVDDLRWDEIGCAGHSFVRTPGIDRIAHEGARFRNAFCTTPLCSPVRASLLTGQYARNHGIVDNTNRSEQSHKLTTFPSILSKSGYHTGYIGKWHMGNDDSARPGFDYWACMAGQGTSFDPVLNENGTRIQHTGHTSDVINKLAVKFIHQTKDKPFCLYIAHKALHPELVQYDDGSVSDVGGSRFLPAKRHESLYTDASIPRRLNVTDSLQGKPALQRAVKGKTPLGRKTGTDDETIRDRLRMLAAVDEGVGQLFDALEKTGMLNDTVIVFTSDHGYWNGEHGLSIERRLAYEEGIRIPLLVRFPSLVRPGTIIDELALSIDLAPTLLELAGVTAEQNMDGRSLTRLLAGDQPNEWRSSFLIEYYSDIVFPHVRNMGYQAIRTPRHKYIRYKELKGMDELYDLKIDPYEMNNLIDQTEQQTVLKKLKTELSQLVSD